MELLRPPVAAINLKSAARATCAHTRLQRIEASNFRNLIGVIEFTPHIAEELWQSLGHGEIMVASACPQFNEELAKEEELEILVQLNGKPIARVVVGADVSDEAMKEAALASDRVQAKLEGKQIVKTVVVSKRLVNEWRNRNPPRTNVV